MIILSDLVNDLWDVQTVFEQIGPLTTPHTRIILNSYSRLWELPLLLSAKLGVHYYVAAPKKYYPDPKIVEKSLEIAKTSGAKIVITEDPKAAAKGADVIYTDVWVSMGMEKEAAEKRKALQSYQVTAALMKLGKKDCIFMHLLPAHRGEEVTAAVIDGKQSVVFQQAENRLLVVSVLSCPTDPWAPGTGACT